MTAALAHLTGPSARSRIRGARVLTGLALALPVPLFAAAGLSLPLPATVERLAAKLVPFADTKVLAEQPTAQARGRIVLAHADRKASRENASPAAPVTLDEASTAAPESSAAEHETQNAGGGGAQKPTPNRPAATPATSTGSPDQPTTGPEAKEPKEMPATAATPPASQNPPTTTPVDTVGAVTGTVDNTVSTVADTVTTVVGDVTGKGKGKPNPGNHGNGNNGNSGSGNSGSGSGNSP